MVAVPVSKEERISIIDALRGLALLGILLMNIPYFSTPYHVVENIFLRNEVSGPNYLCWWVIQVFFNGSMRGIFSMLFGAGSYLLITRLERKNQGLLPADVYYRRIIWLILFGLINAYVFLWPGDILFSYGVMGLLFFPFRNLKPQALVAFGVGFLIICSIQGTLALQEAGKLRKEGIAIAQIKARHNPITHTQMATLAEWQDYQNEHNPDSLRMEAQEEITKRRAPNYFDVQKEIAKVNVYLLFNEEITSWMWENLGFFMLGLALLKWDVLTGKRTKRFYLTMAIVVYAIGLPFRIFFVNLWLDTKFDSSLIAQTVPANVYQIGRLAVTLGHIALFILVYKMGWVLGFFKALAKVGQMAFTNYLSQSLICTWIFMGYGFGLYGQLERYQTYEIAAAIWLFQVLFSVVWMRYFLFGPFEWVWRSLTYWQWQPLLKTHSS